MKKTQREVQMFEELRNANQLLMEAELQPVQGEIFQPTGFKDIGAATYELPESKGSTRMILVESAQSMANRLESQIVGIDGVLNKELDGLSYVLVDLEMDDGVVGKTSSLIEAHRLNSPFIISDENFLTQFKKEVDYQKGKHLNWVKIARAVFKYDINSLLHGIFLANLEDGRIKIPRALSSFIEARGIKEVTSGGVKLNHLDSSGTLRAANLDKDVYGHVPYQRVEYTADRITAYFNLDVDLLRSYRLPSEAIELLYILSLYKITSFLEGSIRLRSRCHLAMVDNIKVTDPKGYSIPSKTDLLNPLQNAIRSCKDIFADPPVTLIKTRVVLKKKDEDKDGSSDDDQDLEVTEGDAQPDETPKKATKGKKRK